MLIKCVVAVLRSAVVLIALVPGLAGAATLTLEDAIRPPRVSAQASALPTTYAEITKPPSSGFVDQVGSSGNHAITSFSVSNEIISVSVTQTRSAFGGHARSGMDLAFSVNTPVFYELSGLYSAVNFGLSDPGHVGLVLNLYEYSAICCGDRLYDQSSQSYRTTNETLVVGNPGGGDYNDESRGELFGILVPGTVYILGTSLTLGADSSNVLDSAYATGNVALRLLPEPGAGVLGLAAISTLARVRARRSR